MPKDKTKDAYFLSQIPFEQSGVAGLPTGASYCPKKIDALRQACGMALSEVKQTKRETLAILIFIN